MKRSRWTEWILTAPPLFWLIAFFVLPTGLILLLSFRSAAVHGGIGPEWTLDTWRSLADPAYPTIIWRTLWLSAACTVISIAMGLPVAYWIARLPRKVRSWALLLIILPFWTNFLIRIFAWRTLLHPDGALKAFFVWLGWVDVNNQLLYNEWAVLLVLVYTHLPFAILPLYAAAERFDFGLLDAARDLGATRGQAFIRIFIPGVRVGMLTALLIVFIPALGSYAIPELVGGPGSEMIGNKIAQRVFNDRNLPLASALSVVLAVAVFLPLMVGAWLRKRLADAPASRGGRLS